MKQERRWGGARRGREGRALDLKQQDLYHLESNLCQLCLQVKLSNLTARVSTWGCGHVQGGVARLGVGAGDAWVCAGARAFVCACVHAPVWAQWLRCRCRFLLSKMSALQARPDGTALSTVSLSLRTAAHYCQRQKKKKNIVYFI